MSLARKACDERVNKMSTITKEIAIKAFSNEFIELMTGIKNKTYEATFQVKSLDDEAKFRLTEQAVEEVEKNILFWESQEGVDFDGKTYADRAKEMRQNASALVVKKYNELEQSWKWDNRLILTFVAPNKLEAEKIARAYGSKVLENYRFVWAYVKNK